MTATIRDGWLTFLLGVRIALILRVRASSATRGVRSADFAERFEAVEQSQAHERLDDVVHCLAIALGGRPAAPFPAGSTLT